MKIKLTTENRLGLTKEVLTLLSDHDIDVKKVEVEAGLIFIQTSHIEKTLEHKIASLLMKITGIKWVESIAILPAVERNLFLTSLLNGINAPVLAINNVGKISYQNNQAQECFKLDKQANVKDIFTLANWAEKIDTAAKVNIAVNINTISGPMLVEVRPIHKNDNQAIGAVLVFHQPEIIAARSFMIDSAGIIGFEGMVVENPKMQDLAKRAQHLSHTQVPLLIYGETGVGKKTMAQAIHANSSRNNHMFSTIDCATLKPSQIEIELFGLSNPQTGKAGIFEITEGGTVYLAAIHELPEDCQMKLLKLIENKHFYRVNGTIKKTANIKIIASAPLPLSHYVDNQQFNPELYYALDITHLHIPPLRQRTDEIEPLVQYFLAAFNQEGGKSLDGLSFDALNKIKSYYWPGNLSQLKNLLFKASLVAKDSVVSADEIEIDGHVHQQTSLENRNLPEVMAEFEKHFIQHWYQKYPSTRKLAAHLGVSHTTIAQKLNKYGIN